MSQATENEGKSGRKESTVFRNKAGDLGESLERLGYSIQMSCRGRGRLWGGEAGRMNPWWQLGGGAPADGVLPLSVAFREVFTDRDVGSGGLKCCFISASSTSITHQGPVNVFLDWMNCTEDTVMLLTRSPTCGGKQTRK